jgi:DNA-binding response OmpR family regulator
VAEPVAEPVAGVVLFVEDDEPLVSIVVRHLDAHGIPTRVAVSAEEAARLLAAGLRPELIFPDINLPGDSGWSLLRSRAYEDAGSPSVVVVSATRVPSARLREFGVKGYLPKPFSMDTLVETARRFATEGRDEESQTLDEPTDIEIR